MYILLTVTKQNGMHPLIHHLITPIKNFSEIQSIGGLIQALVNLQVKEHNQKIHHPPQPGKFILPSIHYLPYLLIENHQISMNDSVLLDAEVITPIAYEAFTNGCFSITTEGTTYHQHPIDEPLVLNEAAELLITRIHHCS